MNRNSTILLFLGFAVVLMPRNASGATSMDEQVNKLAERCKQIEAQLIGRFITSEKQKRTVQPQSSRRGSMALAI